MNTLTVMYALCLPESAGVKTLNDRLLYGPEGGLIFHTQTDARTYVDIHLPNEKISIEKIGLDFMKDLDKSTYRIMVRVCSVAPSWEVREQMEKILPDDFRTRFFNFRATPESAGAMTRAVLWAEGVSLLDAAAGAAIIRLQRQKPFTTDRIGALLASPVPEWEDVGGWDAFGFEYAEGR